MNEEKYKKAKVILWVITLVLLALYVWNSRYELHPNGYAIVDKWTGKIEEVHKY